MTTNEYRVIQNKLSYVSPKNQKIFAGPYWRADSEDEAKRIGSNRDSFAETHGLTKNIMYTAQKGIYNLIHEKVFTKPYEHIELYKTVNGDAILVVSPYGKMSPEELANERLFGTQFIETNELYGGGTTTYYKKFQYRRYLKTEIMSWTA